MLAHGLFPFTNLVVIGYDCQVTPKHQSKMSITSNNEFKPIPFKKTRAVDKLRFLMCTD